MIPRLPQTGWGAAAHAARGPSPSPPVTRAAPSGFSISMGIGTFTYTPATGLYSTDFDITTKRPAITNTYYVKLLANGGSDAANGLTLGTAVATIKQAITLANASGVASRIIVASNGGAGTTGDYVTAEGFDGLAWTVPIIVECTDGGRARSIRRIVTTGGPTQQSGTCYFYTYSTGTPGVVFDFGTLNSHGDPRRLVRITSVADVNDPSPELLALPGSCYVNTTSKKVWFNTYDTRTTTLTNVWITRTGDNVVHHATTPQNAYFSKIDIWGGDRGYKGTSTAGTQPTVAFDDCTFGYSITDNGMAWNAGGSVYMKNCTAIYNHADGFNFHRNGALNNEVFLDTCRGTGNGWNSDGTNNGITCHETTKMVCLNCTADNNEDRNVHNIGSSQSWLLGCTSGPSTTVSAETSAAFAVGSAGGGDTALMWLDGCVTAKATGGYDLEVYGGCTLKTANMNVAGFNNVTTGTLTTYTP